MEDRWRISLLTAVQLPALWWWIDISGNRRRHPADTEAEKNQKEGLSVLPATDHQYKEENNRPGNDKASAVDPIVSEAKHLILLFFEVLRFVIGYITYCNTFVKGKAAKNGLVVQ